VQNMSIYNIDSVIYVAIKAVCFKLTVTEKCFVGCRL